MGNQDSKTNTHAHIADVNDIEEKNKAKWITVFKAVTEDGRLPLTASRFQTAFFPDHPVLCDFLYNKLVTDSSQSDGNNPPPTASLPKTSISDSDFAQFCGEFDNLSYKTSHQKEYYFSLFARGNTKISKQACSSLLSCCCDAALTLCSCPTSPSTHRPQPHQSEPDHTGQPQSQPDHTSQPQSKPDKTGDYQNSPHRVTTEAVVRCMLCGDEDIEERQYQAWVGRNAPHLTDALHQLVTHRLTYSYSTPMASPVPAMYTQLQDNKYLLSVMSSWLLSCQLSHDYIPTPSTSHDTHRLHKLPLLSILDDGWELLYDSNKQGLSVNRFQHHVFEYKAPTLTLFSFEGHCYCLAVMQEWRESVHWYGGENCYLIQLQPEFKLMQSGSDLMFVNLSLRSYQKGIQVGGSDSATKVLEVDEDLNKISHFGLAVPLHSLEVWGCGGHAVREAQRKQKDWDKKEALKSKDRKLKIDVEDWKNSPDRQLLELGGVTTEHSREQMIG